MAFLLFYLSFPDEPSAHRTADHLLEQRLIACANIFPVSSAYWWQNALQREGEWVAVLKTRPELEAAVERTAQKMHPYEVPCLLRFEVRANTAYEEWIFENTVAPGQAPLTAK